MSGRHPHPSEFDGFFDEARQERLAFPRCRTCDRFHWYPMPICPYCQSSDLEWRPVAGAGEIVSFTHVRHPFDKNRRDALPYTVALISFADAPGVRFISNIVDAAETDIAIGQAVVPVFVVGPDGAPRIDFRLSS